VGNEVSIATFLPERLLPTPIFERKSNYLKEMLRTAHLNADQKSGAIAPGRHCSPAIPLYKREGPTIRNYTHMYEK
jgi:hypothetical protein